jgi:hypothetical protein
MRTSTVFARIMTIFAKQKHSLFTVKDVVSKVRALIFGIAIVLVQLKFVIPCPFTFHAFGRKL